MARQRGSSGRSTEFGITQVPPGPGIGAVQRRHSSGTVMLLIDVSNSMQGRPNPPYFPGSGLEQAVLGARRFVDEAVGGALRSRHHSLAHRGRRAPIAF